MPALSARSHVLLDVVEIHLVELAVGLVKPDLTHRTEEGEEEAAGEDHVADDVDRVLPRRGLRGVPCASQGTWRTGYMGT